MIGPFRGKYRFLSNFYCAPFRIDGVVYKSVEHYYQSHKTTDKEERESIIRCDSPGDAKRLGKRVTLREDWDTVKVFVMVEGVLEKFRQNSDLLKRLIETGDEDIVELNKMIITGNII
jgi:ribA/ribD-fused uncharacterized protein